MEKFKIVLDAIRIEINSRLDSLEKNALGDITPSPEPNKGDWRYREEDDGRKWLIRFHSISGNKLRYTEFYFLVDVEKDDPEGYNAEVSDNGEPVDSYQHSFNLKDYKPPTKEEYEFVMLRICDAKGYKPGVKIKSMRLPHNYTVTSLCVDDGSTKGNIRSNGGGCVYDSSTGTWADIIKEEPLPTTIQEIKTHIHDGKDLAPDYRDQKLCKFFLSTLMYVQREGRKHQKGFLLFVRNLDASL